MQNRREVFKFGDRVLVEKGFYEGQTAILTYICPETACLCGYVEGDGSDQLHYFYPEELKVLDRGYYLSRDEEEPVEESEGEETPIANLRPV